jgi:hypothetical protein
MHDSTLITAGGGPTGRTRLTIMRHFLLLWCLFFLVSFGLGYPTLNRYRPNTVAGLSDSAVYYQMVAGVEPNRPRAGIFTSRILVPYLARPVYWIARSRLRTWDPIFFGLLVVNSFFSATTALCLVKAGLTISTDAGTSLVGATLFLLNFAVPNLQLAGLVDAGECCFMMAVVLALLTDTWWLLPVLGIGGALAKETFLPFATVLALAWWLTAQRHDSARFKRLWSIAGLTASSTAMLVLIHWVLDRRIVTPWNIAVAMDAQTNYFRSFLRCISDKGFWYVFLWLLPLGIWGCRRLPRPWLVAAAFSVLTAVVFGVYHDMRGTVARPIFNVAGPMLALSVAMILTSLLKRPAAGDLTS